MKSKQNLLIVIILSILLFSGCQQQENLPWEMKQAPIMTEWADQVDPANCWNVYPRPQMKRNNWKNLNGVWEYAITKVDSEKPDVMDGTILVPFPIESALSGVMKRVGKEDKIWYKKIIQINSRMKTDRILLNFEAVDWQAEVFIDDEKIGEHTGGYDPFSFEITKHIRAGEKHELWVSVWDPTTEGFQPVGKQTANPRGIWYTPSSGIWQTVWIEKVPDSYIRDYEIVPDIDNKQVSLIVNCENYRSSDEIEVIIREGSNEISRIEIEPGEPVSIGIPDQRLWTPEDPFLYDLDIKLIRKKGRLDKVKGYFGMRKTSIGKDEKGITRMMLNNEFVFQNGPLDQGFWPDGLYTPPTDEAMRYDLEMIKKMGFNMLRKHVKVENRRFYYWCDKMGLLVWQDMPNGDQHIGSNDEDIIRSEESTEQFELELSRLIETKYNHPSVVVWVPFNEGWGQYETGRITELINKLDPTRLVNSASGWADRGTGDIHDIHNYPEPRCPEAEADRAIVLGEFGGLGLPVEDHTWEERNWGYENMDDISALLQKYNDFYKTVYSMVEEKGLSASVYTQITDVETETNGLLSYDRKVDKMGAENLYGINTGEIF